MSATLQLLENSTFQDISIEAIALASGVSKATIYRWWPSKASVVIDAFIEHHIINTPMPRHTTVKDALTRHMKLVIEQYGGPEGKIVAQIIAAGLGDPDIQREFRERFFYGRRAVVREMLERGRQSGEIRSNIDLDFIMDVLYAPIYQRLLLGHLPLDDAFAKQLSETVYLTLLEKAENPRGNTKLVKAGRPAASRIGKGSASESAASKTRRQAR